MKIEEIYKKFKINPALEKHQKLVAAITLKICDSLSRKVDTKNIVTAALLHDLGNIVKGDVSNFVPAEDLDYWLEVQNETKGQYGDNATEATVKMIKDLNLREEEKVLEYLSWVGGSNLTHRDMDDFKDLEHVILPYADGKVGPSGIVSIEERMEEANKRSKFKNHDPERVRAAINRMEITIFTFSWMTKDEITEKTVEPYLKRVEDWEVK